MKAHHRVGLWMLLVLVIFPAARLAYEIAEVGGDAFSPSFWLWLIIGSFLLIMPSPSELFGKDTRDEVVSG